MTAPSSSTPGTQDRGGNAVESVSRAVRSVLSVRGSRKGMRSPGPGAWIVSEPPGTSDHCEALAKPPATGDPRRRHETRSRHRPRGPDHSTGSHPCPSRPPVSGPIPKPAYVPRMAWFHGCAQTGEADAAEMSPGERQAILDRATREVVAEQGLDRHRHPDGRRDPAGELHPLPLRPPRRLRTRHADRVRRCATGPGRPRVPTFTGRIAAGAPFLARDWTVAQERDRKARQDDGARTADDLGLDRQSLLSRIAVRGAPTSPMRSTWRSVAWRRRRDAGTFRSTNRSSRVCRKKPSSSGSRTSSGAFTASPAA